ncbi:MAG: hypothetical protein M3Q07_29185, partial [Pseudobdellovibrionaceae bacterium]|nr:hypothetical protein [Pseudobdellovibrionaceae bacterium]
MRELKYLVAIGLLQGCILEKAKNAKVDVSLSASEVNLGEEVTLSWSASDAKTCSLSADGSSKDIPTSGKEIFTPANDSTYLVSCSGSKGKSGSSSASVKVKAPSELFLSLKSRPEALEHLDLSQVFGKPCEEGNCYVADFDQEYFAKDAAGVW